MLDLFPRSSVYIKRIGSSDAHRASDALMTLSSWLDTHESYYPSIRRWFNHKVVPDLKTGRRIGYLGFQGEAPVLAAVLKQGEKSKFCHLSISEGFQGNRLGQLMFCLMAAEVRHLSKEVHFTLPESLWERENGFFRSFGFESVEVSVIQYRLFDQELRCSVSFATMWSRILDRLPMLLTGATIAGFQINDGIVLSVHRSHAESIMNGHKTVEVRRRFTTRWIGRSASVYAAGGSGCLLGTVKISDVVRGSPDEIWRTFESELCCSRQDFARYAGNRPYVFALRLLDPVPYEAPVSLSQLSHLLGKDLRPPQSYSAHSITDLWGRALSVAALLHSNLSAVPRSTVKHSLESN